MYRVSWETHRGKVRTENQDSVLTEKLALAGGEAMLCVVADGMGGHSAGEIASRLATHELAQSARGCSGILPPTQVLEQGFVQANATVYYASEANKAYTGMGTTMTAALLTSTRIFLCHVGDSRAYRFARGYLTRLTQDHSLVEELLQKGSISNHDAERHPQRHVLTRALGVSPDLEADCIDLPWQPGEQLLLCTDGLSGVLTDREIESLLRTNDDLDIAIKQILDLALNKGAPDNVTILLAKREASL